MKKLILKIYLPVDDNYDEICEFLKYQSYSKVFFSSFVPPHKIELKFIVTETSAEKYKSYFKEVMKDSKYKSYCKFEMKEISEGTDLCNIF